MYLPTHSQSYYQLHSEHDTQSSEHRLVFQAQHNHNLDIVLFLQIEAQLKSARSEVETARTSAAATQLELNEERKSRLAAEKLVIELRSKLDSVKSQAAGMAAPAGVPAGAPETNGSGAVTVAKVPVSVGGGKKAKKGSSRGASPTKGFGSPKQ